MYASVKRQQQFSIYGGEDFEMAHGYGQRSGLLPYTCSSVLQSVLVTLVLFCVCNCRDAGVRLKEGEKGGCACIPSQIILTHKARALDAIVKETHIMELDALRERLDLIDERILSLLSERAKVIMQVADFKRHHNMPIYVPEREVSIIERLRTANPGPLPADTVERIYRNILEEMRKFESEHFSH